MFSLRSAQGRAILAGAVLVILLAGLATLAVWRTRDMQQQHRRLGATSAAVTALEHANAQFSRQAAALATLVFSDDPALADRYHKAAAEVEQALSQARAQPLAWDEADELLALDDLTERIGQFTEKLNLGLPLLLEADPETRVRMATATMSAMMPEADAITADLERVAEEAQGDVAAKQAAAGRAADTTLWLVIGFSTATLVVAVGAIAMLIVSVIRPLTSLQASARAITAGDPEARAKVYGPEEVASLARDFNEMTDALATKTQEYIVTTNLTGDIIAKLDKHGRWAFLNDAACQFYGKPREELLGTDSRAFAHPDDLKSTAQRIRKTSAGKKLHKGFVNQQVTPMGIRVVEWNGYPLFDEEGQYAGIQITGRDITERNQAEEALQESEERFRLLFENAKDAIIHADPGTGLITGCNRAAETLLERESAQIIGQPQAALHPPQKAQHYAEMFKRHIEEEGFAEDEAEVITKSGRIRSVLITASLASVRGKPIIQGVFRDITERKQMEEELTESRRMLENTTQGITDSMLLLSKDLQILWANKAALEQTGCEMAQVLGNHCYKVTHDRQSPCDGRLDPCPIHEIQRTGKPATVTHTHFDAEGREITVEVSAYPIRDEKGDIVQFAYMTRDITERKQMEDALRDSEERYRDLFENASDLVQSVTQDGSFVYVNRAWRQALGYGEDEIAALSLFDIIHPDSKAHCMKMFQRVMAGATLDHIEAMFLTKHGRTTWVEGSASCRFEDGKPIATRGIFHDISERKQAQEERERLHAELEVRAITDGLTGLYNHAHFFERLAEEIDRSKRYGRGFSILMMDVDNFKQYNDSRGHQAGDETLCLIADCIRTALRRSDIAFRYGGDEFAAILLHADSPKAQAIVKRMNRCLARRLEEADDPAVAWLRLSAGVACFPGDATTADDLVKVADAALYDAKRVAPAHSAIERAQATEPLASPPETPDEKQQEVLSAATSSLAAALQELTVPDILAELDLRTIAAAGAAAEIKHPHIRDHQGRVSQWAAALAEEMGLPPEPVQDIRVAGLLHDIGKVGVSEHILNKPGKLTEAEYAKIKEHSALGAMIVAHVDGLHRLVKIIRHHHERFDGKGYPDGLAGEDIPPEARILSVVDVFDAMTHERSYRKALSRAKATAELERGAGTQFDPAVVKAFLTLLRKRGEEPTASAHAASEDRQLAAARAPDRGKG